MFSFATKVQSYAQTGECSVIFMMEYAYTGSTQDPVERQVVMDPRVRAYYRARLTKIADILSVTTRSRHDNTRRPRTDDNCRAHDLKLINFSFLLNQCAHSQSERVTRNTAPEKYTKYQRVLHNSENTRHATVRWITAGDDAASGRRLRAAWPGHASGFGAKQRPKRRSRW